MRWRRAALCLNGMPETVTAHPQLGHPPRCPAAPCTDAPLIVSQLRYTIWADTRRPTMAAQTSMLHIRVDEKLKADAATKLADFGLTVSEAVRILLTRIVKEGALPAGL